MDGKLFKILAFSLATLVGTGALFWISKNMHYLILKPKKKKAATRRTIEYLQNTSSWKSVGKVKHLWVYPIKACAGISMNEAVMERFGPRNGECRDRSLVIVDENGGMITGRKINSTVLITPEYDCSNNSITIRYPHLQPLKIYLSLIEIEGKVMGARIWEDDVSGFDCGDEAADWLTLALGRPCRLLYHGSLMSHRTTESLMEEYPLMNSDDTSLYADLSGYMIMTETSLADLEKRTSRRLPPQNFRPNLLIGGCETPYEEDEWTYIKIGESIFRNIKPCDRCICTTIDYKSGKRDPQMEPLKTLKKYRCPTGSKIPDFGINLGMEKVGKVKVGDEVFVLRE